MTVNEFLDLLAKHDIPILGYFVGVPLLTLAVNLGYRRRGRIGTGDYLYSILVHLSGIPGILAATLVFYSLLLARQNMLDVHAQLYFLPVISMAVTFFLISRKTAFERLPGFGRLWGFMLIVALTCVVVLFLYRLRFFIGFFGSLESLLVAGIIVYFAFRIAAAKMTRRRR